MAKFKVQYIERGELKIERFFSEDKDLFEQLQQRFDNYNMIDGQIQIISVERVGTPVN